MPGKPRKLPPVVRMSGESQAQSMWAMAQSYSAAAAVLLGEAKAETRLPALFLLLHALELNLKAFLCARGATDSELRGIGHDLVACMRECRTRGLAPYVTVSGTAVAQVVRVNRYYREKELEYFAPRAKYFGSIEELSKTVATVANQVFIPITEETFRGITPPAI